MGVLPDRFETLDQSRERLAIDGLEATAKRIAATWFVEGKNSQGYSICESAGKKATRQAALASLAAWEKWNGCSALRLINCPTLVLWGIVIDLMAGLSRRLCGTAFQIAISR